MSAFRVARWVSALSKNIGDFMSDKKLPDTSSGDGAHTNTPTPITDNQPLQDVVDTEKISKMATLSGKDKPAGDEAPHGDLNSNGARAESNSKPGPSSFPSDAPASPTTSLSSTSSSSSAPPDCQPAAFMTPAGDLVIPLKAKGYSFRKVKWISRYRTQKEAPTEVRLVTWNVDFQSPDSGGRLLRILSYLQASVLSSKPEPSCILLQELEAASFEVLLGNEWVRKHYAVFPATTENWRDHYGNATLVSRTIPFQNPQMLNFADTMMGRTAILVDIPIRCQDRVRVVRVANTHLESLPIGTPMRPRQLKAIAEMLRADGLDGGVVAGDMNMIGATADQNIHVAAGLDDACLFPDDPASHTWGYQPVSQFPPRRLDRVFFVGEALIVDSVEVIGRGLRTKRGRWVSDHCGLVTSLTFSL